MDYHGLDSVVFAKKAWSSTSANSYIISKGAPLWGIGGTDASFAGQTSLSKSTLMHHPLHGLSATVEGAKSIDCIFLERMPPCQHYRIQNTRVTLHAKV